MGLINVNTTPSSQEFIDFLHSEFQDSGQTYMSVIGQTLNWNTMKHDSKITYVASVLAWGAPCVDKELMRQSVVGALEPMTAVNSCELVSVDCLGYVLEDTNVFVAGGYPLVDVDPSQRSDVYLALSHMSYPDMTQSLADDFYSTILKKDAFSKIGGLPPLGCIYSVISLDDSVAHEKQGLLGNLCETAIRQVEANSDFTSL